MHVVQCLLPRFLVQDAEAELLFRFHLLTQQAVVAGAQEGDVPLTGDTGGIV